MTSCFVVRQRLTEFLEHRRKTMNGETVHTSMDYIVSIRTQRDFVRSLDRFICGLVERWWYHYRAGASTVVLRTSQLVIMQQRWHNRCMFPHEIPVDREPRTRRSKYRTLVGKTGPILRIMLVRVADYCNPPLAPTQEKKRRNGHLRTIAEGVLIPVIQRFLVECIQAGNTSKRRRSILLVPNIGESVTNSLWQRLPYKHDNEEKKSECPTPQTVS